MFSSLTPGKHSLPARSRARSNACAGRNPQSSKHPIMILLRNLQSKSPGMILLQDAQGHFRARLRSIRLNSFRILMLKDKRARGAVGAKRLRMISLQNSNYKTLGIISLQKKVGGGGPSGARESLPRKGYQQDALFAVRKDIRSFRALTKSGGALLVPNAPRGATTVECQACGSTPRLDRTVRLI